MGKDGNHVGREGVVPGSLLGVPSGTHLFNQPVWASLDHSSRYCRGHGGLEGDEGPRPGLGALGPRLWKQLRPASWGVSCPELDHVPCVR